MKKLTFLVALLVVLAGFAISVQAETEKSYGQLLQEIGLIKGSDNGLQEDKEITREEMVTILVRLESDKQGYESFVAPQNPSFTDVPASHWAYRDIEYAYKKGLTGGIGEGKFGLKKRITYDQASLFLLRSLGYDGKEIHFAHAAKEIADKYDLRLQNREVGKAFLKRDQVFELMAKALSMKPKTATGFAKLHTIDLDWPKVDKWLEAVKKASPRPDRKRALRYYNNEWKALDLSIYPKNIEDYIKEDYVREGYENGKIHDKKMKEFIQKYLGGAYKNLSLQTSSLEIKADEYGQTDVFYEARELFFDEEKKELDANPSGITVSFGEHEGRMKAFVDISSGLGSGSSRGIVDEIRRYSDKNGMKVFFVAGTEQYDRYYENEPVDEFSYFYVAYTVDKDGNVIEAIGSSSYGTGYGKKEIEVDNPSKGHNNIKF